jgi:uncharacterized protein YndB with AHSA1/START domain
LRKEAVVELPIEVRREIVVPADLETVWHALTDSEELAQWFATEVELDASPGGGGVFRWGNGEERAAVVEVVEAPTRFVFDWEEVGGDATTNVEFTLEEIEQGTRVTVVETARVRVGPQASAAPVLGEWAWAVELLARIRMPAFARA